MVKTQSIFYELRKKKLFNIPDVIIFRDIEIPGSGKNQIIIFRSLSISVMISQAVFRIRLR